jgi:Sec-independent protein translocase protein TatA
MGDFSLFHWLIVLALIAVLSGGNRLVELARYLGGGSKGVPPTFPASCRAP